MLYLITAKQEMPNPLLVQEAVDEIIKNNKNNHPNNNYKKFYLTDLSAFEKAVFELNSPGLWEETGFYIFILNDKLAEKIQKQKNLKALLPADTKTIKIYPVTNQQFPRWLEKRFQKAGFKLSADSGRLLCSCFEGNILAAQQAVEKLQLFYPAGGELTREQLSVVLADSARYTVFDLIDKISAGEVQKIVVILKKLENESIEPAIVLWGLLRICRQKNFSHVLPVLAEADRRIKNIHSKNTNSWEILLQAALLLAGKKLSISV